MVMYIKPQMISIPPPFLSHTHLSLPKQSHSAIFTVYSHTFTLIWLRKTSVIIKTFQWSFSLFVCAFYICQQWWSQSNVFALRSKVYGYKLGWGRWIFQDVKILSISPPGGTWSCRSQVWDFRLIKKPQAWTKLNRRIHVPNNTLVPT